MEGRLSWHGEKQKIGKRGREEIENGMEWGGSTNGIVEGKGFF